MSRRMPRRLVALSASAVTAIYAAGLLSTHAAADSVSAAALATQTPVSVATQVSTVATPTTALPVVVTPTTTGAASATATATSAPKAPTATSTATSTSSASVSSAYTDGTYTGTGTSRFGDVTVSVTTSAGKITNVQITRVTTKYPASRIASLPAQVVQAQTASVNVVTGATYSSQAFKQAVQQALLQAVA